MPVDSKPVLTTKFHSDWQVMSEQDYQIKVNDEWVTAFLNGTVLWQFNFKKQEGKPYFHPIVTTNGHVFTDLRPEDHPWHRGIWFSWKFLDGVNY